MRGAVHPDRLAIYRGRITLIHDYHWRHVTDRPGYCRAMGVSIAGIGVFSLISGVIPLLPIGGEDELISASVAVFVVGFAGCMLAVWLVQRKYNGGMF